MLEVLKAQDVGSDPNKNVQSISAGGEDISLGPIRAAEAKKERRREEIARRLNWRFK